MKKFLSVLMAAAMLLSVCALTACGGKTTPAPTEEKTEETGAATVTTVNKGTLTMSTNAAFPPYEMTTDTGSFEGIDIEVAAAIAEKLGLKLQVDNMDFDAALKAAQDGKSDMVMAGVTVNPDRELVMDFSQSYATGVQVIILKEGADITLANLGKQTIGTQRGTTGNIYCSDDFGDEHVIAYDDGIAAVQALQNGQVDCVVIDSAPAQSFVKANPGLVILDTEYITENYAIGFAKGNTQLLDAVNAALKELIADGTVQNIIDKYISAEKKEATPVVVDDANAASTDAETAPKDAQPAE